MRMMVLALMLALTACATAQPPASQPWGHQPADEAAVLAVADRFMNAVSSQDQAAMAELLHPQSMAFVARAGAPISVRSTIVFTDPARRNERQYRERYWRPTVLICGDIALVFAPYEFWLDGASTHCGVDTLDLVRMDGHWRIASIMWTVETEGCEGLRPADPSEIRPPG